MGGPSCIGRRQYSIRVNWQTVLAVYWCEDYSGPHDLQAPSP
jgi:hypothetical protein